MKRKATYEIAMAAGRDAGNKSMCERGLKRWDHICWNVAAGTFELLMGVKS